MNNPLMPYGIEHGGVLLSHRRDDRHVNNPLMPYGVEQPYVPKGPWPLS